jgi:hypothetical protein
MKKFCSTLNAFVLAVLTLAFTALVQAQATYTWVSGIGDDANHFSRIAPCKTFAGGYWMTADRGAIDGSNTSGFTTITVIRSFRAQIIDVGDDINPRSHTVQYKTWASAISKTAYKGEVGMLKSVGFGTVSIKDITLEGSGSFSSILSSDINGVHVNDIAYIGRANAQRGPTAALSRHMKVFSSRRVEAPTSNPYFIGGGSTSADL